MCCLQDHHLLCAILWSWGALHCLPLHDIQWIWKCWLMSPCSATHGGLHCHYHGCSIGWFPDCWAGGKVGPANSTFRSSGRIWPCHCRLPVTDLGPSLTQVLKLDQFASQLCSVSGPRRLVALVSIAQPLVQGNMTTSSWPPFSFSSPRWPKVAEGWSSLTSMLKKKTVGMRVDKCIPTSF